MLYQNPQTHMVEMSPRTLVCMPGILSPGADVSWPRQGTQPFWLQWMDGLRSCMDSQSRPSLGLTLFWDYRPKGHVSVGLPLEAACLGDGRNIRDGERKPTEKQPTETIWNSNDYFLPLAPSCIFSLFSLFCCSLSKACCSISKVSLSLGSSGYIDFRSARVSESGTKISYVTKLNLVSKWDFIKLHYR